MTSYAKYDLDGTAILVEVDEGTGNPVVQSFAATGQQKAFDTVLESIKPVMARVVHHLNGVSVLPDSFSAEMGIKFIGEAGWLLAKAGTEAHLVITMSWNPKKAS
jgi:hypothetical protein